MVDARGMAVLDGIQELEKDSFGQIVISNVLLVVGDVTEEVTFWTILQDDISAVLGVEDLVHGNDVWMAASLLVELHLAMKKLPLPGIKASLVKRLDGVESASLKILGSVDDAISTNA